MARNVMLNFMPWRETQCRQAKRRFIYQAAASALIGVFIIGVIMLLLTAQTTTLRQQTTQLQQAWHKLQPQVTYITRLRQTIERIKQSRKIIAHHQHRSRRHYRMLIWLAEHWPAAARLTELQLTHEDYRLRGDITTEDNALATFMTRLHRLSHIRQVDLTDWQMTHPRQGQFALRIRMVNDESDVTV
jgi:Tfp pilus assembly protein PilN